MANPQLRLTDMQFDWQQTFEQAEVLALVPGLKEKTLQNWKDRGFLDFDYGTKVEGRGRRQKYTALDVLTLTVMVDLVAFGVGPGAAGRFGWTLRQQAQFAIDPLLADWTGPGPMPLTAELLPRLNTWSIRRSGDGGLYHAGGTSFDDLAGRARSSARIVVETDLTALQVVNRILELRGANAELAESSPTGVANAAVAEAS